MQSPRDTNIRASKHIADGSRTWLRVATLAGGSRARHCVAMFAGRPRTLFVAACLALAVASEAFASPVALPSAPPDLDAPYAAVLSAYVDDGGVVDYRAMQSDPSALDAYLGALAALEPDAVAAHSEPERIALYINAYNAFTLRAILDHYPIRAGFFTSLLYPKNSIRQIAGVWDALEWRLAGRDVTLEEIEHEILRKEFAEPRIHMALVCAAKGCPPLRNEPYRGATLDRQLDDQTDKFLADPEKFRIDRQRGTLDLSPIFKWFGGDFVKRYGRGGPDGFSTNERAVLSFVAGYLSAEDAAYVRAGDYSLTYLDYDWALNDAER